jgi:Tfp pilus assembly protein PilO
MSARLDALLARLGAAGVLALGVLLACSAFYATTLAPLEQETSTLREAREKMRARAMSRQSSPGGIAEELQRFYRLFPSVSQATAELERLHRVAVASGVDAAQGEYRLEHRSTGLWTYRVTLPVRGSYAQLREFVSVVLADMPAASVDTLRFQRRKAGDTGLEAQVGITLHLRPEEDRR